MLKTILSETMERLVRNKIVALFELLLSGLTGFDWL
jgi:hypothetical protein